ncbi:hypothetical protein EVAR_65947_1 [Eumeta japonica]|uniref:Uncharacterized protein n=1 Tax=Eumeta variegata TaxID=151549 RepID=A0A4C1ZP14_EUMVA|nr:hypothetical protein EVAR_65947_1 [Eumeta japonica]
MFDTFQSRIFLQSSCESQRCERSHRFKKLCKRESRSRSARVRRGRGAEVIECYRDRSLLQRVASRIDHETCQPHLRTKSGALCAAGRGNNNGQTLTHCIVLKPSLMLLFRSMPPPSPLKRPPGPPPACLHEVTCRVDTYKLVVCFSSLAEP